MMHAAITDLEIWGRWREARRLVLVEAFEDSATGTRIKEFRQTLSEQLGPGCQLIEHVWLFNLFRFHELQEIAAEEAAAADLIVISVHDPESLPDEAKRWMDGWLRRGTARHAVVLVLQDSPPDAESRPVEGYLQEAARRGGMEFVLETRAMAE
jgi:hypothetical protein